MIGEVEKDKLITPKGAQPGDAIILTKVVPIEGTAILAREFPERLSARLSQTELLEAQNYLFSPGISVYQDAMTAVSAGKVTAMHDPTEGGVVTALWELAEACKHTIEVDLKKIPVSSLSLKVCSVFDLDPLGTIASGALLITAAASSVSNIVTSLSSKSIPAAVIGQVKNGPAEVIEVSGSLNLQLRKFPRDEITRAFEGI